MTYSVTLEKGVLQLPQKIWQKWEHKKLTLEEKEDGFFIKPETSEKYDEDHPLHDNNVEYFEDEKGMKIHFKKGIPAGELLRFMKRQTHE